MGVVIKYTQTLLSFLLRRRKGKRTSTKKARFQRLSKTWNDIELSREVAAFSSNQLVSDLFSLGEIRTFTFLSLLFLFSFKRLVLTRRRRRLISIPR